jgi:hypothetical protein
MKTSNESFVAFFSYVRRNDEHDKGRLTELRKLLESELWAQTGKDFKIFQDTQDIPWGTNWKERITNSLDKSTFLIAVVTPSYLESQSCRFEFEYFLKQESQFKRKLSLPILYIDTSDLKDTKNEIAVEISKRQWLDWRDLRFTSLTSSKMNKKLELLAKQIRDLISDEVSIMKTVRKESALPPNSVLRPEKDKDRPLQQITVMLRSTGDKNRNRKRIKAIYGTLISFHGHDRFSFQIYENGKTHLIDFPDDTTRVCTEVLERLMKLMGEESWRVEETTL